MERKVWCALLLACWVGCAPMPQGVAAQDVPAAAPLVPAATIDDTLEVTGEALSAKLLNTRLTVDARVNGRGPFRFLVDSGSDRTVIGVDLAKAIGASPGPTVTLHSAGGTSRAATVMLDTLQVGSSQVFDIAAPALPERFIGAQGVLGIDALADQRLMLDFQRRQVTVQDTRTPEPAAFGEIEIVVTARRHKGQLILTQVKAGARSLYGVIDTGSELTVGNSALRAAIFRGRKPPPAQPVTLISVTGERTVADLVVLPELRIGGLVLGSVPVAFTDAPPFAIFGIDKQPAMLIGTDVLAQFARVSLDFRHRRIRFVLRERRGFRPLGNVRVM